MKYENFIVNSIDEALCDCLSEFDRRELDGNFEGVFSYRLEENLITLVQEHKTEGIDTEYLRTLIKRCEKFFKKRIYDALQIAHQSAYEAFEAELNPISQEMLKEIEA